jgi:hypothetical protein
VQADEQANVQPEPAVPQVQNLPVPVIPPVQQVLPPVQPVPTQNQGVQAEPVVANGENLLNILHDTLYKLYCSKWSFKSIWFYQTTRLCS